MPLAVAVDDFVVNNEAVDAEDDVDGEVLDAADGNSLYLPIVQATAAADE